MTSPTNFGFGTAGQPDVNSDAYGALPNANYLYGREGLGYSPQGMAGIPQITQQGWAQQLQGLGQQVPIAQQFGQLGQSMAGSFGDMTANSGFNQGAVPGILGVGSSMDFFNNPHLDASIAAAQQGTTDTFNQTVMPQMNRGLAAAGPGAYSSDRAGISEGLAQQGLQKTLANTEATMRNAAYGQGLNAYGTDRGQTLNAAQQATANLYAMPGAMAGAAQLAMMPGTLQQDLGSMMGQIGNQQAGQMQGLVGSGMDQWNWTQQQPYDRFNQYNASIDPYMQYGQSGSKVQPEMYNPYPNAAMTGGLMQGIQSGVDAYMKYK